MESSFPNMMPKIFYDHIGKTAGTSFRVFLCDAFGEEVVTPTLRNMPLRTAINLYKSKKVITGHFQFKPGDNLPADYVKTTILRDPRDRALSTFFFIVNDKPAAQCDARQRKVKQLSLEEFLGDAELAHANMNAQSRHFARLHSLNPEALPEAELLRLAKACLDQYDLVGTTERLAEFVGKMKELFPVRSHCGLKNLNVTSRRARFEELSQEIQNRIEQLNAVDIELWQYANHLFDNKTRLLIPGFWKTTIEPSTEIAQKSETEAAGSQLTAKATPDPPFTVTDPVFDLLAVSVNSQLGPGSYLVSGELATLRVAFQTHEDLDNLTIGINIASDSGLLLFGTNTQHCGYQIVCRAGGTYHVDFCFPVQLGLGSYSVGVAASSGPVASRRCHLRKEVCTLFQVVGSFGPYFSGLVRMMPSLSFGPMGPEGIQVRNVNTPDNVFCRLGLHTPEVTNYLGSIALLAELKSLRRGEQLAAGVEIVNKSTEPWVSEGNRPVRLSYHWRSSEGETIVFDGLRTPLPGRMILPGQVIRAEIMVEAPQEVGDFLLILTLVQEHVAWFEDRGFTAPSYPIQVGQ
jgi:hypothetical protein